MSSHHKKILTIGLGGATCGGKSTLARLLCKLFGEKSCQKLNQDDFYFSENYTGHTFLPEFTHINWELESAFDNAKLVKTVNEFVENSRKTNINSVATTSVVSKKNIESVIQTLEDPQTRESLLKAEEVELSPWCQKLFERFELGHQLLVVEGIHVLSNNQLLDLCDLKVYVTLDHKTCTQRRQLRSYDPPDPPNYFQKIVWPTYAEQFDRLKLKSSNSDCIHFLDGRKPLSENFLHLLQLILRYCAAKEQPESN